MSHCQGSPWRLDACRRFVTADGHAHELTVPVMERTRISEVCLLATASDSMQPACHRFWIDATRLLVDVTRRTSVQTLKLSLIDVTIVLFSGTPL
jgi:hypothetical protein